ncbi:hypothetical protein CDL15_Pgr000620 [Punica granatum]|uniref:Bulb-type lectin domain-containing protein n=1 Tax=Punica granatum TaxID=22663 RepID=A0A218W3X4_PUNGR|nr:hypothetical protein CDL15_Pgr000620 [Punica granatum]
MRRGTSVSIEDDAEVLVSPKKTFTCGFYGAGGNAYYSIWFTGSRDCTVVWMANRDKPVNGKGSRLNFPGNGVMVLTDVDGTIAWETNTTSTGAHKAELLESGNLFLKDPSGRILWQSFDNLMDTLLPNQPLTNGMKLISSIDISSRYWPNPELNVFQNWRTNYNSTRIAILDDSGKFLSSDRFQFTLPIEAMGSRGG